MSKAAQARPPRLSGSRWRAGVFAEAYIMYVAGVKPAENAAHRKKIHLGTGTRRDPDPT